MEKRFMIEGFLINQRSNKGIAGLDVEVWEKDRTRDDYIGRVTSASDGSFNLIFSEKDYRDYRGFIEKTPSVYFKVFSKETLITQTTPQNIASSSGTNKLRKIIDIVEDEKSSKSIMLDNWEDLAKQEVKILERIKSLPNGSRAFITNPLLCLAEVEVIISDKFRQILITQHPTLSTKSAVTFNAVINNKLDDDIKINLSGLFRRAEK